MNYDQPLYHDANVLLGKVLEANARAANEKDHTTSRLNILGEII
jgi:hypothetical protein